MTTLNFRLDLPLKRKQKALFSLPQTDHYHTISHLRTKATNIIKEETWKNKVALIKEPGYIAFRATLKEQKATIQNRYTLSDYRKIPPVFMSSNRFINGADPDIISLAKKHAGKEKKIASIIRNLYDFTLGYLNYGKPIDGLYSYRHAMEGRVTDCGGFSTFLASLLQAAGIPSRLVVGFFVSRNPFKNFLSELHVYSFQFQDLLIHAWLDILLPDGSLFPLDPSIEWRRNRGLTRRKGGFGFIPEDRLVTSYGCDFELKIDRKKYTIDLLQKPVYIT